MSRRSRGIQNSKRRKELRSQKAFERSLADSKLTEQELASKRLENKSVYDSIVGGADW